MPGLSNWREDFNLAEVVTGKMTDTKALQKVSEKSNINNKVTINPKLDEAVKEIGGEVVGMVEADTTAQKQRIDMKQMILDRQKLKIRRKDLSAAKKEQQNDVEGDSTNASKQSNVIAQEAVQGQDTATRKAMAGERKAGDKRVAPGKAKQNAERVMQSVRFYDKITKGKHIAGVAEETEETVKQVNEKKRKNALQIQKIVGEGVALDAFNKITDKEKREKNKKELARLMAIYNHQKDLKKRGLSNSYEPEGESLDERLGGKGYQPYTNLRGEKISGDWEDSDRGKGNKAKKRAGGKVEKKSPTYKAHVLNKEEVVDEGVMKFVKGIGKKKKVEKKPSMDTITTKVHKWRKDREKEERRKYVSDFDPIDEAKGYQPEIEHSKLGDAKKKADKKRESKLPPHLQGDAIGKMRKAFASEDKAFDFVKNKLKAKYGDGVLTTGEKMKPPTAAQKKAAAAHQAKVDAENAAERAKDPSQGRYPKG